MFNFATMLDHNFARRPEQAVLTFGQETLTNRTLFERVNALAHALADLGVTKGDLVAIVCNNRPEVIESIFAINRLGAAFLPLNTRLAPREWAYILRHADAKAVIVEGDLAPALESVASDIASLQFTITIGAPTATSAGYEQLIAASVGRLVPVTPVAEDDLHRLMYTSGTTSRPKGVPISFRNLLWKNFGHILELGITDQDINLVCGPLYHVGALDAPALDVLHAGGHLLIHRKFDATEVLRSIHRDRPTIMWLAPAMINMLLHHPEVANYDTSSLRLILFGGEKTPRTLIEQLSGLFPNAWLSDAYGLTETASADTFNDAEHALSKAGSVGRPVRHLEVKVFDLDGGNAGPGELGEIALRGPQVFSGYWRDEQATARAFRDGWFLTGDIGRLDADGYLYVEDRQKDMIVSGGENIASSEVERVLYEHPYVLEAAVVAAPDSRWGEVPMAFLAVKPGHAIDDADLRAFCAERLAKFKVPKYIHVVDALPRNPSGKVLKRDLRERAAAEHTEVSAQ